MNAVVWDNLQTAVFTMKRERGTVSSEDSFQLPLSSSHHW
ncbi:hypothetical protein CKA32_005701 [Geitlerinema sp. FC II]|nr:hypothetical protein CKA32_005701 [Geitlerinema sp. FC II]